MAISYTVDHEKRFIVESWTGEVSAAELASYWRHYLADPHVLAIRRTLVDLRRGVMTFSGEQLSELIRSIVIPTLDGRSWKTALLVERPVQFGVSRQYQVFAETFSEDAIFDDQHAALEWLLR